MQVEPKPTNRLRELRETHGHRLITLAHVVDRDQSGYYRYETGETPITVDQAQKLAAFYGCTLDYLMGYSDKGGPKKRQVAA